MLVSIEFLLAIVIFISWLLLIVFIHFIRKYGQAGFKVEMANIYCSVKEVLSCLYMLSHWTCIAIMTCLVIINYKINGSIVPIYWDGNKEFKYTYDFVYPSLLTHDSKFAIWFYITLAIYFIAGIYNTMLAVELFGDRGRVPDREPCFTRPDYIGQNLGWPQKKLRDPFANYVGHSRK